MTYVKPRRFTRKPKDILFLTLKNLWPGEEIICTQSTYSSIESRVEAFRAIQHEKRVATIQDGQIRKIRRVA
jgi:hypothetical protein